MGSVRHTLHAGIVHLPSLHDRRLGSAACKLAWDAHRGPPNPSLLLPPPLQIAPAESHSSKAAEVTPADGPHWQLVKQAIMETLSPAEVNP